MNRAFLIDFDNGHSAPAIEVGRSQELPAAVRQVGLQPPRRTLVLVGGAGKMSEADLGRMRPLFDDVLGPLAAARQIALIDGGTDAGVMRLAGEARMKAQPGFDLIGVAAVGTVVRPGRPAPGPDAAPLESRHSHFILVPGVEWGAEAPWIAHVASALALGLPSATILINGGAIAWHDVAESVKASRPVLVVAGSGRTADDLAGALRGERDDQRATALIATGLLRVLGPPGDAEAAQQVIREALVL